MPELMEKYAPENPEDEENLCCYRVSLGPGLKGYPGYEQQEAGVDSNRYASDIAEIN
jgi:hypothetical protein